MKKFPICYVCGLSNFSVTRHHIIPRDKGGSDHERNIVMLCEFHHNSLEGKNWEAINMAKSLYKKNDRRLQRKTDPSTAICPYPVPEGWRAEIAEGRWKCWRRDHIGIHFINLGPIL